MAHTALDTYCNYDFAFQKNMSVSGISADTVSSLGYICRISKSHDIYAELKTALYTFFVCRAVFVIHFPLIQF